MTDECGEEEPNEQRLRTRRLTHIAFVTGCESQGFEWLLGGCTEIEAIEATLTDYSQSPCIIEGGDPVSMGVLRRLPLPATSMTMGATRERGTNLNARPIRAERGSHPPA